MFYIAAS